MPEAYRPLRDAGRPWPPLPPPGCRAQPPAGAAASPPQPGTEAASAALRRSSPPPHARRALCPPARGTPQQQRGGARWDEGGVSYSPGSEGSAAPRLRGWEGPATAPPRPPSVESGFCRPLPAPLPPPALPRSSAPRRSPSPGAPAPAQDSATQTSRWELQRGPLELPERVEPGSVPRPHQRACPGRRARSGSPRAGRGARRALLRRQEAPRGLRRRARPGTP
eukprot:TRINITY_DN26956_c0_g1_i2.p3 TRINITY_DN26956_c0_g1~~TRINITY_DN26956_c0_g1_i2.p3  ORF type:complete len:243 (+),score=25.48 TRINITY_DN26956_c0_g1_i2:62-730(+)